MEDSPSTDTAPVIDVDYARSVVSIGGRLERVQKMLPLLPREFHDLLDGEDASFLRGTAVVVQAIHDLIGNEALDDAARLLQNEEDNLTAIRMSKVVIGTFGMLEAMGFVACQKIIERHDNES